MSAPADYLSAVYGTAQGRAHIAVGTGQHWDGGRFEHRDWTQTSYAWPAEADALGRAIVQETAAGADVYVCPYLMHGDKRAKGAAVERAKVHADIDGHLDLALVAGLGAYAVASGTAGHGHVYADLAEPVPAHWHEALCRGLGAYLGDADAKISDNDVLRPAGTLNHKSDPATPVAWLRRPNGRRWEPQELARALRVTLPDRDAPSVSTAPQAVEEVELPQRVRDALANVTDDRSADTMRVIGACHDAGLKLAQARYAVSTRTDLARRLADRRDDDVLTCWLKATDSRAERKRADAYVDEPGREDQRAIISERSVILTKASSIAVRPVKWLWAGRLAEGTLALLGGREGIGKSTIAYTLAADYTRGRLPGEDHSRPRAVIVAATEDSWSHTINPRLMAAGADLDLVYRVDVTTPEGSSDVLTLPRDIRALEEQIHEVDAGIVLLDPLISRLDKKLDAHKDPEVRWALEPLVAIAERARVVVLGLIHVNKTASTDPLTLLMGSRAFAAVARAVLFVMKDPDNEDVRLLGQPKNNLGRTDLPTLTFRIETAHVADTKEGPVLTGRVVWQEDLDQSISDVLAAAAGGSEVRTAVGEAADWLHDWLTLLGGTDASANIKTAARKAGHSESAVQRARRKLKLTSESEGSPNGRRTSWSLPATQPGRVNPGESEMTDTTDINTGQSLGVVSVVSVVSDVSKPPARARETWPPGSIGAEANGESAEVYDLAETIAELGGTCPTCGRFICECEAVS